MNIRPILPVCAVLSTAGLVTDGNLHAAPAPRTAALLAKAEREVRIVAFGDSITGCYYHTGGLRAWPELVELLLRRQYPDAKVTVLNAGRSGHTSARGLKRIQRDVLDPKPDLVVVAFGMNDAAYGKAAPAKDAARKKLYRANMTKIVEQCRGVGAEVILCTPTNVYPEAAPRRPPERLAQFAEIVRELAAELGTGLADCYAAYEQMKTSNPAQWRLLMSETIHPGMHGHKLIAEVVAEAVSGKKTQVGDLAPPQVIGPRLLAAVKNGKPIRVVAMTPCMDAVKDAFSHTLPDAKLALAEWPVEGQGLDQLVKWATKIRKRKQELVVVTFPAQVLEFEDEEHLVRQASWVLNWSLPFGGRGWDVVCLAPSLPGAGNVTPAQQRAVELLRSVVAGNDVAWLKDAAELRTWLARQLPGEQQRK